MNWVPLGFSILRPTFFFFETRKGNTFFFAGVMVVAPGDAGPFFVRPAFEMDPRFGNMKRFFKFSMQHPLGSSEI